MAEREVRSIAYHMKAARFPAYKDLSGFDFSSSEMNEATVRQLHRCEFMEGAQNIVLIGGPGTGKTHVATALGIQAIEHHRRKVRFFSTIELVNALEQEKTKGKAGQLAETLVRLDLVILDELGYLPFSASGGALLFHLLSKLYGKRHSPAKPSRASTIVFLPKRSLIASSASVRRASRGRSGWNSMAGRSASGSRSSRMTPALV